MIHIIYISGFVISAFYIAEVLYPRLREKHSLSIVPSLFIAVLAASFWFIFVMYELYIGHVQMYAKEMFLDIKNSLRKNVPMTLAYFLICLAANYYIFLNNDDISLNDWTFNKVFVFSIIESFFMGSILPTIKKFRGDLK